ncbi:type IV toxin-antitoxin system AbiEi family antitoxin [Kocuria rhizophila]|uniref:type IV toxin-antitoxin system AbiEi family antitoxin n=1 Tax=Kocuria rhizophila TaxID=72000 RepID=UPI003340FD7C
MGPPGVEDPPPSSFPAPAPPLLTYADLKAAGEPRQLEAAQHVKDTHAHLWRP